MKAIIGVAVISAIAVAAAAGAVGAAGKADMSPGRNKEASIVFYQLGEPTGTPTPSDDGLINNLGGAISGGFFGNTSNSGADSDAPARGHGVTPSVSPGPSIGGCADVTPGASLGHVITGNGPAAVGKTDPSPC